MPDDPAGLGWRQLIVTAGVAVDELHMHRAGDQCGFLWRVTDLLTGESVTLSAEQWCLTTRAWADLSAACGGPLADADGL